MAALLTTVVQAARIVLSGGIVVVPTDTVYGLAGLPVPASVSRIFEIKRRPAGKEVQLLVPDASWLQRVGDPNPTALALAAAFWPGPLTLVVAAGAGAPAAVAQGGTIGLRMPAHPVALDLLSRTGPLAASSANHSGEPTPATIGEIEALLGASIDGSIDGGTIEGTGSTVLDLTGPDVRFLRTGPIGPDDVTGVLSEPI